MVTPYALQVQPLDVGKAIGLYQQGEQEKLGDEKRQKQDQFSAALPAALATNADPSARQAALAAAPTPDQLLTLHNAFSQMDANSLQRHGQQFDQAMRVFANVKDQAGLDQGKAFLRTQKFDDPAMFEGVTMESLPHAIAMSKAAQDVANAHLRAQEMEAHIDQMKGAAAKDNAAAATGTGGKKGYTNATMADFRQPDGTVMSTLAQQDKGTGQWVTADEKRTPLGMPESITPTGSASRFKSQAMRVQAAAQDTVNTVRAINSLPITASSGFFGGAEDKRSFLGAPLNYFRQKMNSQDVQSYNVLAQGLAMNIATLEAQGLAPNEPQINQANARLLVQPGDTYLTRLQKMAALRQHSEGHLEPMLHSNLTSPEEKNYIRGLLGDLKREIPYTPQDVIALSSAPGQMTFADFAKKRGFKPPQQPAATQPATPQIRQEYGGPDQPAGAVQPSPAPAQSPATSAGPKEGDRDISKSGKPIVFHNGQWGTIQ